MRPDPETLRTYARIFEMPRRDVRGGPLWAAPESSRLAAAALRLMANALEREPAIALYYETPGSGLCGS